MTVRRDLQTRGRGRSPTWSLTAEETQISPDPASASSRAATFTPSPNMSFWSTMTSPRLIPIRYCSARAAGTSALRRIILRESQRRIEAPGSRYEIQRGARHPVVFMIRPRFFAIAGSMTSTRLLRSRASVPTSSASMSLEKPTTSAVKTAAEVSGLVMSASFTATITNEACSNCHLDTSPCGSGWFLFVSTSHSCFCKAPLLGTAASRGARSLRLYGVGKGLRPL